MGKWMLSYTMLSYTFQRNVGSVQRHHSCAQTKGARKESTEHMGQTRKQILNCLKRKKKYIYPNRMKTIVTKFNLTKRMFKTL